MKRPTEPRGWLIDIEGVLVRDKSYRPVDGSVEWLQGIAASGAPFCLVSNNTTHRPQELIAALRDAGFPVGIEHLVGALGLGIDWLREHGRERLLWLGAPHLADFWREQGFDPDAADATQAVVLGVNPELEIAGLDRALPPLLDGGADLVCLHRNLFYLDAEGRRRLGPGCWAACLEAAQGAGMVVTVGKPGERIYREALKRIGVAPREALFISDDPAADLVTAGRLGMGTAFVLSGKYTDHSVLGRLEQEDWPDIVCARPADLAEADFRPRAEATEQQD